jgi:hypothetical protein
MSLEQEILQKLSSIDRRLAVLERAQKAQEAEYLTAADIKVRYGVSPDTIRHMRYEGKLTDYKCTATGRNYRYCKDELEKYLSVKMKIA